MQSQMDDKDRTIRMQQTLIDKLETEIDRVNLDAGRGGSMTPSIEQVDTTTTATQTDRVSDYNHIKIQKSYSYIGFSPNRSAHFRWPAKMEHQGTHQHYLFYLFSINYFIIC